MIARPRDHVVLLGLPALAEAVARWIDDVPGVPAVYLFGSRVRGDHRPSSDIDLCLFFDEWAVSDPIAHDDWWGRQYASPDGMMLDNYNAGVAGLAGLRTAG